MTMPKPQRLSASNASKHLGCHASANLPLAIPNWVAPDVDPNKGMKGEGTAIHEIMASISPMPPKSIEHMITMLQYLHDLTKGRRFKKLIEHKMVVEWLVTKPDTTADLVFYTQDELHIIDWKWGKIPVPVVDNAQLKYYAVSYSSFAPLAREVTTHIVQPAADNLDSHTYTTTELAQFMDEVQQAELAILGGSVSFTPGDHCTFCPANPHGRADKGRPFCPTMMNLLYPPVLDLNEILGT